MFLSKKELNTKLNAFARSAEKQDALIHTLATSAIAHRMSVDNGYDNSFIPRILNAMPKGSRVERLRDWFNAYGAVKVTRNADKSFKAENDKNDILMLAPAEIAALPVWWSFNKGQHSTRTPAPEYALKAKGKDAVVLTALEYEELMAALAEIRAPALKRAA